MIERICIILLANFLFYFKTLGYKYSSDDIPANMRPKESVKWKHWLYVIEGRARHSEQIDHALTMFIHAAVCVGIYTGFGASDVSFLAAILFSFNPATNQAGVWIAGRAYALSSLAMVYALSIPVLGPLFLLAGAYFNSGFVAPVALLGSHQAWMVALMPFIWLFHYKRFKVNVGEKIKTEMLHEDKKISFEKVILATKTFGFYLIHSLIPIKNSFYHSFLQSAAGCMKHKAYTIKDRFFWIGLISIISIVTYWIVTPWTMVSFGLLWWCVCIAPFCNFVRIHQEIAERYQYLPTIGLMYVLASVTIHYPMAQAAIVAMYATKMWFWMDAYQDDFYLTETSALTSPDSWFAWHVKAMKRWDAKSHQEAIIYWTMARNISPKEFKINLNIATACALAGHKKEAEHYLKIAEDNIPKGQEGQAGKLISEWRNGQLAIVL